MATARALLSISLLRGLKQVRRLKWVGLYYLYCLFDSVLTSTSSHGNRVPGKQGVFTVWMCLETK